MARLRLALAALDDLRDIRNYSKAAFGARATQTYLAGMRAMFAMLRARPMAGAPEHDLGAGLRGFVYRSHRVYYRLDDDVILIVRILHHARDATSEAFE